MRKHALLAALAATLPCAACGDSAPPPMCQERTRHCLNIVSGDVAVSGTEYFEVRLSNVCQTDIEYKLCFEGSGGKADCRQSTLAPAQRTEERIALARFEGRTRIFMRFVSEAKACRFPLTEDVKF